LLLTRERTVHSYVDISEELQLSPLFLRSRAVDLSKARNVVRDAYTRSHQLGIIKALYYYCRINPRGARPRDLLSFLNKLGIEVRDNYLRAELSYLGRKGVIVKEGERYRIRENFKLEDLEKLVDIGRSRAGRKRWFNSSRLKDWRPKHSINAAKLIQAYNLYNLVSHIKTLIEKNGLEALATLLYLGGGLRPSDRVIELGYKEGSFYAIVYETKLNRFRLICEEYDRLWHELLREEEVRQWLLEVIRRHDEEPLQWPWKQEYKWRVSREEWDLIASSIRRKKKRVARRVYLAYQALGQALVLGNYRGKCMVVGVHLDPSNDDYYIVR